LPLKRFSEGDDKLWESMSAINMQGTARVMRLAVQQFLKQPVDETWGSRGRVVNISSGAASFVFPLEVAYAASKAAVNQMTRAAAIDHAADAININCIAPGIVATAMARPNFDDKNILALLQSATPWPRLGNTQDIAQAVLFLVGPGSTWITGHVLSVDGGATLGTKAP
jgi:NAD(P)-dependent dehydrogenase (short-subunit alcohol dehydrogenase family)